LAGKHSNAAPVRHLDFVGVEQTSPGFARVLRDATLRRYTLTVCAIYCAWFAFVPGGLAFAIVATRGIHFTKGLPLPGQRKRVSYYGIRLEWPSQNLPALRKPVLHCKNDNLSH
jgi:hypothetical protein